MSDVHVLSCLCILQSSATVRKSCLGDVSYFARLLWCWFRVKDSSRLLHLASVSWKRSVLLHVELRLGLIKFSHCIYRYHIAFKSAPLKIRHIDCTVGLVCFVGLLCWRRRRSRTRGAQSNALVIWCVKKSVGWNSRVLVSMTPPLICCVCESCSSVCTPRAF